METTDHKNSFCPEPRLFERLEQATDWFHNRLGIFWFGSMVLIILASIVFGAESTAFSVVCFLTLGPTFFGLFGLPGILGLWWFLFQRERNTRSVLASVDFPSVRWLSVACIHTLIVAWFGSLAVLGSIYPLGLLVWLIRLFVDWLA